MKETMAITFDNRDEFKRKSIALKMINLLGNESLKVSPMLLDGSWGTGKTEFCTKLIDLVMREDSQRFRPVYIDAFNADHADQPLMTLLAAILDQISEEGDKETIRKLAIPVLRFGTKALVKAAIGWVLKQDAVDLEEDLQKEMQSMGDSMADHAIESMLRDHEEAHKSIRALQRVLEIAAAKNPIVLFIDELDRCRPDFSVAMLETIKHILDVPGVKFVLVTNATQLKASINHRYGNALDAKGYLDKFIRFSFRLPTAKSYYGNMPDYCSAEHYTNLICKSTAIEFDIRSERTTHDFICHLIVVNKLSLRDVETFVTHLEVYNELSREQFGNRSRSNNIFTGLAVFCVCFLPEKAEKVFYGGGFIDLFEEVVKSKTITDNDLGYSGYSFIKDRLTGGDNPIRRSGLPDLERSFRAVVQVMMLFN